MNTLRRFSRKDFSIPAGTSWYLADLGEFRGKQTLFTQQSPQRLKTLREHALIESAVSSNRIEGVSVDPSRVRDVLVAARPLFRESAVHFQDGLSRVCRARGRREGATRFENRAGVGGEYYPGVRVIKRVM